MIWVQANDFRCPLPARENASAPPCCGVKTCSNGSGRAAIVPTARAVQQRRLQADPGDKRPYGPGYVCHCHTPPPRQQPARPEPPAPKPEPPAASGVFCPRFHPIGGTKVFDPSGPLLDDSGRWHLWEDEGGWSNFSSRDLMRWQGTLRSSTHFNGLTGSVSPTPSGTYAFWPGRNKVGVSAIESAVCEDCTNDGGWSNWTHRGFPPGLVVPAREAAGSFRDPARAFLYEGSWFVGVGCGQSTHDLQNGGGAVCLFKATNDSLAEFTDAGTLYRTNHSHGSFGRTVQVYNRSQDFGFNMIECPDIFPLGDSWVLLASIAHGGGPNQWWTGRLSGSPPRFTPDKVGILDYGYGYAAKSGSSIVQSGSSRRVVFGFTGWAPAEGWEIGHAASPGDCGRFLVLPRELTVQSGNLHVDPVPETAVLRVPGSATHGVIEGPGAATEQQTLALATGAQLEVHIVCNQTGGSWPAHGEVALRTLSSADGDHYTAVGWDFGDVSGSPFFVDHTHCCANKSTVVQRAVTAKPRPGQALEMRVWVDSGMIEAFSSGVVITALLNPAVDAGGLPEARLSSVLNTAQGVRCVVSSYRLSLNASTTLKSDDTGDSHSRCVHVDNAVSPPSTPSLYFPLTGGSGFVGNTMGAAGHQSTLSMCDFIDASSGVAGLNWTRGATNSTCATTCPYPRACFYEFTYLGLIHGITPWGHQSGSTLLPVNTDSLASIVNRNNASFRWTDHTPTGTRSPTGGLPKLDKLRLIYDFYLMSTPARQGENLADNVTDEFVIDLLFNPSFMSPCEAGKPREPMMRDAVVVGDHHFDLMGFSDTDKMSPTAAYCRGWDFRRQGGAQPGDGAWRAVPSEVDLLPFAKFAATYKTAGRKAAPGKWFSVVELSVEVTFLLSFPSIFTHVLSLWAQFSV